MYLSHYDLALKPFQINPDPKFMWLGATHKEALAILKYGILDSRGFLLLVGDVGTGKTTLINGLLNSLDENTIVATIHDPGLEKLDFFNFLANAFKIDKKFTSKGDFLVRFIHFLHKAHADNKRLLVIIDEAQRLTNEMLEEIRLLSNIEKQDARLLNVFLVGQDELNETLAKTESRALLQRITTRYNIGPLKKNEIGEYIKFRLSVAGTQRKIFSSGAVREITAFSKCYPRLINIICDHALLTGFVKGVSKIDAGIVKECAQEIGPPKETWQAKGKKLVNIGKTIHKAVISGDKSAWRIPAAIVLSALMLIAAGYFYFPAKDNRSPLNSQSLKAADSSLTVLSNQDTNHTQKLQASLRSEKTLPESRPSANSSLLQRKTAGPAESKASKKEDVIKAAPPMPAGNQKVLMAEKKKQDVTASIDKPAPFRAQKLIVHFPRNSNEFTDEAYEMLDRFVAVIFQNPEAEVIVKGYTDSSGNYSYNKRLSRFRANIVKSYFVGQGVSPQKIKTFGMGPENPIASNDTIQGRSANRRIEIELKRSKTE